MSFLAILDEFLCSCVPVPVLDLSSKLIASYEKLNFVFEKDIKANLRKEQSATKDRYNVPPPTKHGRRRRSRVSGGGRKGVRPPPQVPRNVPALQKMFHGPRMRLYRKLGGTEVRNPTRDEVTANAELVTYVKCQCESRRDTEDGAPTGCRVETKARITKEHVIARNPDIIGYDENGNPVYNQWLIEKNQFFQKYGASEKDLSSLRFTTFHKKVPIEAIEITDEVIRILGGGKSGRALIQCSWSSECMQIERGGLLTQDYSISVVNRKDFERIPRRGSCYPSEPKNNHHQKTTTGWAAAADSGVRKEIVVDSNYASTIVIKKIRTEGL